MTKEPPAKQPLTAPTVGADHAQARRVIWALFAVAFLSNVSIGARILIIPLYGSDLGLSSASIGLLYAVFAGVAAVVAFPAGVMLDRGGSRRVMASALALIAVAQVLTLSRSVPVLAVSQALGGAAWTVSQLSIVTASISAAPRQIGRAIGLTALGGQTGLMAGPALAGTLLRWIGFTNLIILTALPTLVALGIALVTVRGLEQRSVPGQEPPRTRELLKNPAIRQIAVLAVAMGIIWGTFQAYFAIFASRGLLMPAVAIGWLIAIAGLANASSRIPAGRLVNQGFSEGCDRCGFGVRLRRQPRLTPTHARFLAKCTPSCGQCASRQPCDHGHERRPRRTWWDAGPWQGPQRHVLGLEPGERLGSGGPRPRDEQQFHRRLRRRQPDSCSHDWCRTAVVWKNDPRVVVLSHPVLATRWLSVMC